MSKGRIIGIEKPEFEGTPQEFVSMTFCCFVGKGFRSVPAVAKVLRLLYRIALKLELPAMFITSIKAFQIPAIRKLVMSISTHCVNSLACANFLRRGEVVRAIPDRTLLLHFVANTFVPKASTARLEQTAGCPSSGNQRERSRWEYYSIRKDDAYVDRIKRFVLHFGKRHPRGGAV